MEQPNKFNFYFQRRFVNDTVEFTCKSGETECYGNKIQACAIFLINNGGNSKGLNYNRELLDFVKCFMENIRTNFTKDEIKEVGLLCEMPLKSKGVLTKCGENEIGKILGKLLSVNTCF